MFKVPEKYRIKNHPHPMLRRMNEEGKDKNFGAFEVKMDDGAILFMIASDGFGWEHVSIHAIVDGKEETPTWEEMCFIKDLFWGEDDCVIQYHPAKKDYVNCHEHTLHLWRPKDKEVPTPPKVFV